MDDSCAVCAESLEWVAYGACGHKDVCSTCVARLRFICNDSHCCICKTETAIVFVTKALGDYTKTIGDFSLLPSEVKEGRVGQYWYHEDTQALFDDLDHYKMIKAMCRLSCSECDKMEGHPEDGSKRRARYKNIDQLKGHLFHKHKLLICSLCLEGRKVFVCEQKLYTRSQLTQHINTGDSEVDGTESERGGFSGHPMCEFCRTPFYGDNELYTHMSTEHYTCHICQRQHPGQYEYYKNYDDLEIHFRRGHFLCEDDGCLAKKFIVFQSEAELKRHNALEHGGRMSRSQRSVALQIPTSFRYRSSEQQNRRGRGLTFRLDPHDNELSLAIQASLETAPSRNQDHGERFDVDSLISPLESIELQSRYRQAVSQSSVSGTIGGSAFPPLAVGSRSNQQSLRVSRKTSKKEVKSTSSAPSWPAVSRTQPVVTKKKVNASSSAPHDWSAFNPKPVIASHDWPGVNTISGSALKQPSVSTPTSFAGSLRTSGRTNRPSYSSSAPSLSFEASSSSDFPPVSSAVLPLKSTTDLGKAKDVHTANKSLLEKMRAALGYDEDKFTAFRDISGEYRHGTIDVETYLVYVDQFGLSHLVLELARLLPNGQKQKELIEVYNLHMAYAASIENVSSNDIKSNGRGKGKGKCLDSGNSTNKNSLADHVISSARELPEEEVEVLRKNGYRSAMGKSKVRVGDSPLESSEVKNQIPSGGGSNQNAGNGSGKGKLRKKTSKFYRVRLGDGSVEALLDLRNGDRYPDADPGESLSSVPVPSVWRNGGGHKLFSTKK